VEIILRTIPRSSILVGNLLAENAEAVIEARCQALSQTLTPEQLQIYREKALKQLEMVRTSLQMFKTMGK
jgi:hypothetical protein